MDIHTSKAEAGEENRIVFIEKGERAMKIYKDTVTGVHYLVYRDDFSYTGTGSICVMVDADGKPLV